MNFKVYTDQDGSYDNYSGGATCCYDRSVLVVEVADRHILYGPNGWIRVESDREVRSVTSCEVEVVGGVDVTGLPEHHLKVWVDNSPLIVSGPEYLEKWRRGR